jgi:excisionase family DNA binding protein
MNHNGLQWQRGVDLTEDRSTYKFLTVTEVANLMRVSNMTVYRLIRAGRLNAVRVGNRYRVNESDVHKYLDSSYVKAV